MMEREKRREESLRRRFRGKTGIRREYKKEKIW